MSMSRRFFLAGLSLLAIAPASASAWLRSALGGPVAVAPPTSGYALPTDAPSPLHAAYEQMRARAMQDIDETTGRLHADLLTHGTAAYRVHENGGIERLDPAVVRLTGLRD